MFEDNFWKYFFEFIATVPRQGPGTDEATARALNLLSGISSKTRVLDIGCGTGTQALSVARRCPAEITATDIHAPFLKILKHNAALEGLNDRIDTRVADMAELPFDAESFDLLWAEGSIFIIGFRRGLDLWRRLLKPGGKLVVSELCWFEGNIPEELRQVCMMRENEDLSLEGRRRDAREAGYTLLHEFRLPREGWWENYYLPVQEKLVEFEARYSGNPDAMLVGERCRHEIDLFLKYEHLYGYNFFILEKQDGLAQAAPTGTGQEET